MYAKPSILSVALPLVAALALAACDRPQTRPPVPGRPLVQPDPRRPGRWRLSFETMGTDANVLLAASHAEAAQQMTADVIPQVERVNALMSTYKPDSEISRLNAAGADEPVALSPPTMTVLREAIRFSRLTDGAFDVTYSPLRDLWRAAQREGKPPTEEQIRRALLAVGSDKLLLTEDTARFTADGMSVDLGGIAKGFAIDQAVETLAAAGVESAMVDIGGDMRLIGRREDGEKWKVLVRDPREDEHEPIYLHLADVAVATSGDYARYFRVGDERFSHIVDPRTGRPVGSVPSATVVAPDATTADALATAVSVLDAQRVVEIIDSLEGVECMIMVREAPGDGDGQEEVSFHYSRGFRTLMEGEEQ